MAGISHDPQAYAPEPIIGECAKCEGRGHIFKDVRASYMDTDEDECHLYDLDVQECPDCGGEGIIMAE